MANPTGALYLYMDYVDQNNTGFQLAFFNLDGSNNVQSYSMNTSGTPLGSHTLTAWYHGDNNFPPTLSAPATITVNSPLNGLTITVTPQPSAVKQGDAIAVTITLTPQ